MGEGPRGAIGLSEGGAQGAAVHRVNCPEGSSCSSPAPFTARSHFKGTKAQSKRSSGAGHNDLHSAPGRGLERVGTQRGGGRVFVALRSLNSAVTRPALGWCCCPAMGDIASTLRPHQRPEHSGPRPEALLQVGVALSQKVQGPQEPAPVTHRRKRPPRASWAEFWPRGAGGTGAGAQDAVSRAWVAGCI